jgi:heme ABC exporter ATP-binding subunit CcmA
MSVLIEIEKLSKTYDLLPVLKQIDIQVLRGEFVALLGPNGSGKSTLLKLLSGTSRPTQGTIRIGGWELPREAAAVRAQIGLVSHKALVYEHLTAAENLTFYGRLYGLTAAQLAEQVPMLLNQVGLAKRMHDLARTYSRGMMQRLSIARALIHNPDVLLLDEPYTGLDQDASAVLDGLLREMAAAGRTILMTTHDLGRAATLAGRVLILSRGKIALDRATAGLDTLQLAALYTELTNQTSSR